MNDECLNLNVLTAILFLIFAVVFFPVTLFAEEKRLSIPDREIIERLTRLEEGYKSLREQMVAGHKSLGEQMVAGHKSLREQMVGGQANLQVKIDGLRDLLLGGFAIMFTGMFALIGFVIWDRRTALSPVISKTKELEEREDLTMRIFKEYARKEPRMADALRALGVL